MDQKQELNIQAQDQSRTEQGKLPRSAPCLTTDSAHEEKLKVRIKNLIRFVSNVIYR